VSVDRPSPTDDARPAAWGAAAQGPMETGVGNEVGLGVVP